MIIIDENVDQYFFNILYNAGFTFKSVREFKIGLPDKEIIKLVKKHKGILLTEDKDFGEFVYSHNIRECSIIFLRYKKSDITTIGSILTSILNKYLNSQKKLFITITKSKVRINEI